MKVGLRRRNPGRLGSEDVDVHTTSAHIVTTDPLYAEHRRIWGVLPAMLTRLAQLEGLGAPTSEQRLEARLLGDQVRRLRRQSVRICEVLRDETWDLVPT